jgi:hypothetical protein
MELIQHIAIELKENVLRHKLLLKDQLSLEWNWQEEPSRGGIECTIFAHIPIGSNPVSIHNKKHLHWKALESISSMNNEIEFTTLAHSLFLKQGLRGEECQSSQEQGCQPPSLTLSGSEEAFHVVRSWAFSNSQRGHT